MSKIGEIRRLAARRIRPGNPAWVNSALRARAEKERSMANQQTSFGRHWQVIEAVREKCLPQLAATHVPVRALVIGAGGQPYPEVFEVKNMLMQTRVDHRLGVMDIRREALLGDSNIKGLFGVKDIPTIRVNSDELTMNKVPPGYYIAFLGKRTAITDGHVQILEVQEEARKGIELFHGDILTAKLPPKSIDLVFCFNVLEHYSGKLRQLGALNIAQGLRSGGFLIVEGVTDYGLEHHFKGIEFESWFTHQRLAELGFQKNEPPLVGEREVGHFALEKI